MRLSSLTPEPYPEALGCSVARRDSRTASRWWGAGQSSVLTPAAAGLVPLNVYTDSSL